MREWLINVRKDKKYTQAQVAGQADIERSYYAQLESGKRDPSHAVAAKVANILGFNPVLFYSAKLSEPFHTTLEGSPIIVANCDLELRYTWIFNTHFDFTSEGSIGKRDDELAANQGIEDLMALKRQVIETQAPVRKLIQFPLSNGVITYDVYGKPMLDENDNVIGASTISTELDME